MFPTLLLDHGQDPQDLENLRFASRRNLSVGDGNIFGNLKDGEPF